MVPDVIGFEGVVIFFAVVGGVVAGVTEVGREHAMMRGQGHEGGPTVELRAEARRVAAGDQRGASDRANGGIGERVVKDDAVFGERLDVWRGCGLRVVESRVRGAVIFGDDPNNVGAIGGGGDQGRDRE